MSKQGAANKEVARLTYIAFSSRSLAQLSSHMKRGSQVNFGSPNPATDEKALWSKGKRVRCHTPCLPKVPRGRARRSRATTRERIPHRQGDRRRPSRGTSRPTGNTGETWEGNPIGSQRIHSTCSLPDFIFFIFESKGEGISFLQQKKNGADLTRHNLTIHPIPMICA